MNSSPLRRQVRARPVLRSLYWIRNGFIIKTDDARVGESDAKDITGEVVKHRLFAVAPGGDMEDPRPAPHRLWDDEIRTLSAQHRAELAAHQFGKSLDGEQELPPRRMPGGGVPCPESATVRALLKCSRMRFQENSVQRTGQQ
jgi:hypothetical protein